MRMHRKSSGADETLWLHCARVEGNFDIIEDTQAATKWLQQLGMARSDRKVGREPGLEWTPGAISRDRSKTERLGSILAWLGSGQLSGLFSGQTFTFQYIV
jgi:hypothetical protein